MSWQLTEYLFPLKNLPKLSHWAQIVLSEKLIYVCAHDPL